MYSLQGSEGELVGIVDFWVRLFNPAEPVETVLMRGAPQRSPVQSSLGWQDTGHEVKMWVFFKQWRSEICPQHSFCNY